MGDKKNWFLVKTTINSSGLVTEVEPTDELSEGEPLIYNVYSGLNGAISTVIVMYHADIEGAKYKTLKNVIEYVLGINKDCERLFNHIKPFI